MRMNHVESDKDDGGAGAGAGTDDEHDQKIIIMMKDMCNLPVLVPQ